MTETSSVTWLTQEAYDRLKAELDHLAGEGRTEIATQDRGGPRGGRPRENGGYHAAKEEQGKQEARIRQLRQLLENAQVGEAPAEHRRQRRARHGRHASTCSATTMTFLLGSREVAGDTDLEVYSAKTPLGAAIIGRKVGDSGVVHRAERQGDLAEDPVREAVHRLSPPCHGASAGDPGEPGRSRPRVAQRVSATQRACTAGRPAARRSR